MTMKKLALLFLILTACAVAQNGNHTVSYFIRGDSNTYEITDALGKEPACKTVDVVMHDFYPTSRAGYRETWWLTQLFPDNISYDKNSRFNYVLELPNMHGLNDPLWVFSDKSAHHLARAICAEVRAMHNGARISMGRP
jgi:hypothetical protein